MPKAKHKILEFNGLRYYHKPTGYFKADFLKGGEYMHRAVWMHHYGSIPSGFSIHHRNEDKSDNSIENLELLPNSAHASMHAKDRYEKDPVKYLVGIEAAREAARKWHGSPAGLEWHKTHGKETWVGRESVEYSCAYCSKMFTRLVGANKKGFCSMSCQGMARVKSGVDDEKRNCSECGTEFSINRYKKRRTCSKECTSKAMVKARKANK